MSMTKRATSAQIKRDLTAGCLNAAIDYAQGIRGAAVLGANVSVRIIPKTTIVQIMSPGLPGWPPIPDRYFEIQIKEVLRPTQERK